MADRAEESSGGEELDRLIESFTARIRAGEGPRILEYEARAPNLAEEIRELFPAIEALEGLGSQTEVATDSPTDDLDPDDVRQLGDFRILRRIGQGGMGEVFEAEQVSLGRHVALKVLPPQAARNPGLLERFRREAKAAAKLHHTNIVPVFEVGEQESVHYYAMQFVRGHSLKEILEDLREIRAGGNSSDQIPSSGLLDTASSDQSSEAPFFREIARLGRQVANALEYAHGEGVVHRDIKPANLILDADRVLWIADFGLAKAEGVNAG